MPFSMYCTNKGCGEQMEPYLDLSDDKVYCSNCDREIVNVTHFVKVQMKTLKQFRQKKSIAFGVKCKKCSRESVPKILNDKIVCSFCDTEHTHLSEPFKILLKDKIKNDKGI